MSSVYLGTTEKQKKFLQAVESGNLNLVKKMIEMDGFDPNIGDDDVRVDINPICCASLQGNVKMTFYLIETGKIPISEKLARYVGTVINDISTSNYIFEKLK